MQNKRSKDQNYFTILGCGTSTGVPLLFCKCKTCSSRLSQNKRLRASGWFMINDKSILIDTSPDLRQQALKHQIPRVDAVLYTHPHADHIGGLDELRSFNFIQKERIPLYGNDWTYKELKTRFPYIFRPQRVEGGGIPLVDLHRFSAKRGQIEVCGLNFQTIAIKHGSKECIAYRWDRIAYVTDCSYIPKQSIAKLEGLDVLVLDCLRARPHPTHLNFEQALELIEKLRPSKAILTHMGHDIEYHSWSKRLPKGVSLAFDGMKVGF